MTPDKARLADKFAVEILWIIEKAEVQPTTEALTEYVNRYVCHNYTTRHEQSRRAVIAAVLATVTQELAA